jgi:ATP-dependent Clp protease ATP-binding subunit ClpA
MRQKPLDKRETLPYRQNHGSNSTAPCGRIMLLGATMPPSLQLFLIRIGFPASAGRVLDIARFESRNLGHNFIGSEHVLCALVRIPDLRIHQLLIQRSVDLEKIRTGVVSVDTLGPHQRSRKFRPMTPRLKRILPIAESESKRLPHLSIPQSLFLGILIEGQGVAIRVLKQLDFDVGQLRHDLETPKNC